MRLITITLILAFSSAHAAPVTWTIDSLIFDDGGTASGTFTYDADVNTYSDISIITTLGSVLPGSEYNFLNPSFFALPSATNVVVVDSDAPDLTDAMGLSLIFASALSNTGGVVDLAGFVEATCVNSLCDAPKYPQRGILSGSVSAVPVPAAVWLFGSALAGLGWMRRKQAS